MGPHTLGAAGITKIEADVCYFWESAAMQYPVVAEIWSLFESTLSIQAKKLVEDIAKHEGADPKALWAKVRPQVRVGLLNYEMPEDAPTTCSHSSGLCEGGAIRLRCRAPCMIGFDACPRHIGTVKSDPSGLYELVARKLDYKGAAYFVDKNGIAHDKNGRPKGHVKEDVLYLFEVGTKP
jgi:hypothetical protein